MTPHIQAKKEEIAKVVLMPGDPLRAKFIADTYLKDAKLVNKVRNVFMYTGTYKGVRVTIAGSGMGVASMGIYSYELFKFYDVDAIMRIGSAGAYSDKLKIRDIVVSSSAYSESNYPEIAGDIKDEFIKPDLELTNLIKDTAKKLNTDIHEAVIHSSDVFYNKNQSYWKQIRDQKNCDCVEMESTSLFTNAIILNKKLQLF